MFWTPIVPHVKECITILHTLDCGRAVLNSDLKKMLLPSQERPSPFSYDARLLHDYLNFQMN